MRVREHHGSSFHRAAESTALRARKIWLLGAALTGASATLITPAAAQAVLNVTDGASLSAAINTVDTVPSASGYVINFQNNITLTGAASDTLNAFNTTSNVTVNGNNFTLNGGGVQRGFFIYSGTVAIDNLSIQNAQALGGAGGSGGSSAGGGSGGLGAGGALFIASGGNVTVSNVTLSSSNATGGGGAAGAAGSTAAAGIYGGAGGGLGGNGGNSGGGGGVGSGANGGSFGAGGSAGIVVGAASGGSGNAGGGPGGANGGGGGGPGLAGGFGGTGGGGGGVAGAGAGITTAGTGGFGGGGGSGGNGATGGGGGFGGGSAGSVNGSTSGGGGFGGGGGGGGGPVKGSVGPGSSGSNGGFGAGAGGSGGNNNDLTNSAGGGGGGGGAGLGGAIFVQQGGNLTIAGAFNIEGNTVTAGSGGSGGASSGGTAASGSAGGNGSAFGSGIFLQGNGTITFQPGSGQKQTISDTITDQTGSGGTGANAGSWNLALAGAGTLVLSGTDTYTGATTVSGGTLEVDGAITGTSSVTVGAGGMLTGTGIVDPLTVSFASGATFAPGAAPGTFMNIVGNLVLAPGATYAVSLNPASTTYAVVNGTATLTGATAHASFAPGSYVSKRYTILTTTEGLGGTTFANLTNTNLPSGAADSLSYDTNDVYLNLAPGFTRFSGLSTNPQNVANALTNDFNASGGVPAAFFGLSASALTQIDGEAAVDGAFGAFKLMDQFLGLMLDPFVDGRSGTGWPSGGGTASGFAPDRQTSLPPDIALAYAKMLKAPPARPAAFDQRWSAWGGGFGGYDKTDGNSTVGSNTVTSRDYGYAGGMDYHVSPDTVAGFALAGGGTNWGLAQNLGGGRSDAFQAGVYGTTRTGPAYVAAAFAFANHWMSTSRFAVGGDQLTARFNAQGYGGRIEAGYRYVAMPTIGITPYAALQAQSFRTPRYSETDVTGGGFGLSYDAMNATDTRSELGARFDDMTIVDGMPLSLRARTAWAHDWVTNPALDAVFQTLPGASFIVNGATPPKNSALASAGAELHMTANWSLAAKFDGEFASGSQTYAGTGTLRYSW